VRLKKVEGKGAPGSGAGGAGGAGGAAGGMAVPVANPNFGIPEPSDSREEARMARAGLGPSRLKPTGRKL
jgi:hypothetical protein